MTNDSAMRRSRGALAGLMGLLVFATSCDGPNRFGATPVEPTEPEISEPPVLEIQVPTSPPLRQVVIGDSVFVQVRAADDAGLKSMAFSAFARRGDPLLGTLEIVPRFDVKSIDFTLGADSTTPPVLDTLITRYMLPDDSDEQETVYLTVTTQDLDGQVAADTVPISVFQPVPIPPTIAIQLPRGDSLSAKPIGDSVFVRASAQDDVGIDSIRFSGVAFRGDPDLGTDEVIQRFNPKTIKFDGLGQGVFVKDTTVMRYLIPVADTTREDAFIIAEAWDSQDLIAADTVRLVLGGPDVELLTVQENQAVQAGLNLNLGVRARDPNGVIRIDLILDGAIDTTFSRSFVPSADSVQFDTILAIPETAVGTVNVSAIARNSLDISGQDGPVSVRILPIDAGDTIPPRVNITVETLNRYELTDSLFVTVFGQDDSQGSGVVRAGVTARAISAATQDTVVRVFERSFSALTGSVSRRIGFQTFNVDPLSLPDTVVYQLTGYMVDAEGNCAAADAATGAASPCEIYGDTIFAEGRSGFRTTAGHVSGRTINLPRGGVIADAVVDTARQNLFLSNPTLGQVEVFRLGSQLFGSPIRAGSEPWGLALTRDGDSLWVANSRTTSFSVIDLTTESEANENRFFTPDVVLFDIQVEESDLGVRFLTYFFPQAGDPSFTDQPQFVAVDAFGNPIYSTVVNGTGTLGTARKAFFPTGSQASEVKLFTEHGGTEAAQDFWAVANIDNVGVSNSTTTETDSLGNETEVLISTLTLFDHVPGYPDSIITGTADLSAAEEPGVAASRLRAAGSDVTIYEGSRWDIGDLGFGDTTYVAASGDGNWVAIGEGARDPASRVLMYQAAQADTTRLSGVIPVTDFLTNTSERVRGVAVTYDGTLAVARGDRAYFFSEDLRKQGETAIQSPELGAGAAFHPLHANVPSFNNQGGRYNPNTHLAFVGSGQRTIDVIDTWRGAKIGEVVIRDIINGPLKAALPFPGDNTGLTCAETPVTDRHGNALGNAIQLYTSADDSQPIAPDGISEDACVVANVYAITNVGGVVVVPIRKADILRFQR